MTVAAAATSVDVPVVNAEQATFECIFGRGCDGICCRNGRPPVYAEEAARIEANLATFLPELRTQLTYKAERAGRLRASGERADLTAYLPLTDDS